MKYIFRFLFVSLLILSVQLVSAQGKAASKTRPTVLNHVAIYVNDLAKSTAFYENVLLLQRIPEPFKDGLHQWFSIGLGIQMHVIQGAAQGIKHDKHEHLCFSVASLDDFIAALDKQHIEYSNMAGTAKAPTVRVDGVKQIYFQDPDGYWIEVNNDIPKE
jgi:lactoylglutathione lyase